MSDDAPLLRLLGTISLSGAVLRSGRVVTLLARLAVGDGRVVPTDRLIAELWPDEAPDSAQASLHVYVSRLRRQLAGTPFEVATRGHGYVLLGPQHRIDVARFVQASTEARTHAEAQEWTSALEAARSAEELWTGEPFGGAVLGDDLRAVQARLASRLSDAREARAAALIELGHGGDAEKLIEELLTEDRLNERRWRLRMRAQHAAGTTALALASFDEFRRLLAEELGVDPDPLTRRLHQRLLQASADDAPAASGPGIEIISRRAELSAIDYAIRSAAAGAGRVVLLSGEPGIGKTVLIEHAVAAAEARGVTAVVARGVQGPGTPPLWMWEEVLGALGGGDGAGELHAIIDRLPGGAAGSDEGRFRLAQAICTRVVEHAHRRPLVLVLDDLQWADESTVLTTLALASGITRRACSLVLASRSGLAPDGVIARRLADIARLPHTNAFDLDPFGRAEVGAMLPDSTSPVVVQQLLDWTGGNPYFLRQMIAAGPRTVVPSSAIELLRSWMADLDDDTRGALQLMAVAGRRCATSLLADAAHVVPARVPELLDAARERGLVRGDNREWSFTHDLAREAVLAGLGDERRAALHGRLADAMVRRDPDGTGDLEQYANHRFEAAAGMPSRDAYRASVAAADHARAAHAYPRAATHRERALAMLEVSAETRRERFTTLLALAEERRLDGDVVRAAEALGRAIELAERLGDRELLVRAVTMYGGVTFWNWRQFDEHDDGTVALLERLVSELPPEERGSRAELLGTLAVERYYGDERSRGVGEAEQAAELARQVGDPVLRGRVLNNLFIANWFPGRDPIRLAALDESLALAGHGLPPLTEAVARMHRVSLRLRHADIAGYEDDLDRLGRLVPRLLREELDSQFATQVTGRAILRGEFRLARELAADAADRFARTTLWGAEWVRLIHAYSIERMDGEPGALADALVEAATAPEHTPLRWTAVLALAQAGRMDEARDRQSRWNIRRLPAVTHWGSELEWAQAAETAVLLGSPRLDEVYARLRGLAGQLIDVGSGLAAWGTMDGLLARLADALGEDALAAGHRDADAALTDRVGDALGCAPGWVRTTVSR